MAQFFTVHPENPQARLIAQAADILRKGGLVVYPTDSSYAVGCHIGDKLALDRIRALRQLSKNHNFTLMCRDLSELANYARVNNAAFRIIKNHTPGPYTFILSATSEVPRRLMHPKRKTLGLRVPSHPIPLALLAELDEPIMSTTLILPNETTPLSDPYEIRDLLEHQVELVLDGGFCGLESTSVVDLTQDEPEVVRKGCGDVSEFIR